MNLAIRDYCYKLWTHKKTLHNSPARARYGWRLWVNKNVRVTSRWYYIIVILSIRYSDVIMGVSNHHPRDCLLNRLYRRGSKKTSKLRVTGLCAGNSPVTSEFPAQMASNAENVFIWWRHHVLLLLFGQCEQPHRANKVLHPAFISSPYAEDRGSLHIAIIGDPFRRQWII